MAQNDKSAVKKSNSRIVTMLVGMVFFMSGFSFALVPLYDVFCEITGLSRSKEPAQKYLTSTPAFSNRSRSNTS